MARGGQNTLRMLIRSARARRLELYFEIEEHDLGSLLERRPGLFLSLSLTKLGRRDVGEVTMKRFLFQTLLAFHL